MRVDPAIHVVAAVALGVGCSNGTRPDGRACPQTYEFGNYGCADVRGVVLDDTGTPRGSAAVIPRLPEGDPELGYYGANMTWTDSQGRFSIRLTRRGPPLGASERDTVLFYLIAAVRQWDGSLNFSRADSVLVRAETVPVGGIPQPAEVELRLPPP